MTVKIETLDYAALERAAQINRSLVLAATFRAAFRWVANLFAGNQEALRFRGNLRLT